MRAAACKTATDGGVPVGLRHIARDRSAIQLEIQPVHFQAVTGTVCTAHCDVGREGA